MMTGQAPILDYFRTRRRASPYRRWMEHLWGVTLVVMGVLAGLYGVVGIVSLIVIGLFPRGSGLDDRVPLWVFGLGILFYGAMFALAYFAMRYGRRTCLRLKAEVAAARRGDGEATGVVDRRSTPRSFGVPQDDDCHASSRGLGWR